MSFILSKFKLFRYNILAVIQVVFSLLNSVLNIHIFGITPQTDAYFMAFAIFGSLQLIQLLLVEQFMYFYNDIKARSAIDAQAFYQAVLTIALSSGILFYLFLYIFDKQIAGLFAGDLNADRFYLLLRFIRILSPVFIIFLVNFINDKLMNAEARFSYPYLFESIPVFCTFLCLLYLVIFKEKDILFLSYGYVAGSFLAFFLRLLAVNRILSIPIRFRLRHETLPKFLANSISMRFGHNIHNFLFFPITIKILSGLPSGNATCFYQAQKLLTIIQSVVVTPFLNILSARISTLWSNIILADIFGAVKKYARTVALAYLPCVLVIFFSIPFIFQSLSSKITEASALNIKYLFLALSFWIGIISVESGFVVIVAAAKKSHFFILANSIFIISYFTITHYTKARFGVYSIAIGAITCQLISFCIYFTAAMNLIGERPISHKIGLFKK